MPIALKLVLTNSRGAVWLMVLMYGGLAKSRGVCPSLFNPLSLDPIPKLGTCEHCLAKWNLYLEAKLDADTTNSQWCELESVAVTAERLANSISNSEIEEAFDASRGAHTLVREAASPARQAWQCASEHRLSVCVGSRCSPGLHLEMSDEG